MKQFDIELQDAKNQVTRKMDARQKLYELLQKFFDNHGFVPTKYLPEWNAYQADKRPWKLVPGVERRLRKAARKIARNAVRKSKGKAPRQSMKIKRHMPRATKLMVEKIRKQKEDGEEDGEGGAAVK